MLGWFESSLAALVLIWALYLGLRLAVLAIAVEPTSDAEWYFTRAASLAAGHGYLDNAGNPTAFWPPGLSLALAALFKLTGPSILAVGLFNFAAAALCGQLTLMLGRRLFEDEGAARAGLLLLALYPNSIAYVPLALTEVFYTALLLAGCWLLVARRGWLWLVAAGLVFGLATLVKAQTLVVIPLVFALDWLRRRPLWPPFPRLFGQGMLVLGVALLAAMPWTLRNHAQLGHWVAVSTNGGYTLLTGNHDLATGDYSPDAPVVQQLMARTDLDEVARDAEARRLAVEWIERHPDRFLQLAPQKLLRLWLRDGEGEWAYQGGAADYARFAGLYRALRYGNQAYYLLLMLGFAAGFVLMTRRRLKAGKAWLGWWLLPYGLALYPTAICIVFSGQSRFHYPIMPFVCMVAGWLWLEALRALGRQRAGRAG